VERLFGLVLEEGDEVVAVLGLLETTEGHLGARDVLLGVLEVLEQCVLVPGDALLLVGVGVRVAVDLAGLAAEEAVEHGADLVALALLQGVALSAAGLEEVGTLLSIACNELLVKVLQHSCHRHRIMNSSRATSLGRKVCTLLTTLLETPKVHLNSCQCRPAASRRR